MKQKKNNLNILVGNIGNGKTTLAKSFIKEGYLVVSRDSFRYMIGAGEYTFNYMYEKSIKRLQGLAVDEFLSKGFNVIVDSCNMTKSCRASLINIGKKYNCTISCSILKQLPQEECVQRRLSDPHGDYSMQDWMRIWESMAESYEKPEINEGFDFIYSYSDER